MSTYTQNQDLINVGAYNPGTDAEIDIAVSMRRQLLDFLRQGVDDRIDMGASCDALAALYHQSIGQLNEGVHHDAE
jgi:flagellum-specific ATP synthase